MLELRDLTLEDIERLCQLGFTWKLVPLYYYPWKEEEEEEEEEEEKKTIFLETDIVVFILLSLALYRNFSQTRNLRLTICSSIYDKWNEWLSELRIVHDAANLTLYSYYENMIIRYWLVVH